MFDLYSLLPEYIRRQDAERMAPGETLAPLQALITAAQSQGNLVYEDIKGLGENFFVETCQDWVLPYIADLIDLNLIDDLPANNRREVARTIGYRRRKGTVPQLETMARDVTGYDCRVVEFFTRLMWNQSMIHFRFQNPAYVDVRDAGALARIDGAFDRTLRTADVRPSTQMEGRYAIRKLGFFLWRLQSLPLHQLDVLVAASAPAGTPGYHFNALDQPAPLFQLPGTLDRPADAPWPRIDEYHVSSPVLPRLFLETPQYFWNTADAVAPDYSGPRGFTVYVDGVRSALGVVPCDLCDWTFVPPIGKVAVDVRLGRFAFNPNEPGVPRAKDYVTVSYYAGFPGNIGGAGYERDLSVPLNPGELADIRDVTQTVGTPISDALTALAGSAARVRVVRIKDSRRYGGETLPLPAAFDTLIIEADQGQRPTIVLSGTAAQPVFRGPTRGGTLILRGLLITGAGETLNFPAQIANIRFEHCTIEPGGGLACDGRTFRPAGVKISAAPAPIGVSLQIVNSIVSCLALPQSFDCVSFTDSIADAQAFPNAKILIPVAPGITGPPATAERSTLLGDFGCYKLDASDSIFTGTVTAQRRQVGCVRFSGFGPNSSTPRRYECVPDGTSPPTFTSRAFGNPAYTQLALNCPAAYLTGGDDGTEIGVWASLGAARRQQHLQFRLTEYLPAGLVPDLIFAT
jgi:hypothetical protein